MVSIADYIKLRGGGSGPSPRGAFPVPGPRPYGCVIPKGKVWPGGPPPDGGETGYMRGLSNPFVPRLPFDGRMYRANFGVTQVVGLTWKPEMAGTKEDSITYGYTSAMDLDLCRYKGEWDQIALFFDAKVAQGLQTIQLSLPHFVSQGWTVDDIAALIRYGRSRGCYFDVWLIGGPPGTWDAHDQDWSYWEPIITPWLVPLLDLQLVDSVCDIWQADQGMNGYCIISVLIGVGRLLQKYRNSDGRIIRNGCHWCFYDACASWLITGDPSNDTKLLWGIDNRFTFHEVLGRMGVLHVDHAQVNPEAPPMEWMPENPKDDPSEWRNWCWRQGFVNLTVDLMQAHYHGPDDQGNQVDQECMISEHYCQPPFDEPYNRDRRPAVGAGRGYVASLLTWNGRHVAGLYNDRCDEQGMVL